MTTNEEQEFNILKIFVTRNITSFTIETLPLELKNLMGSGAFKILKNMARDGFVLDELAIWSGYQFTTAGHTRYEILKRKKRNETTANFVGWGTLILAGVSAFYAIAQYYKPDNKAEVTRTEKTVIGPTTQKQPDTSKVPFHVSDSAKKLKYR